MTKKRTGQARTRTAEVAGVEVRDPKNVADLDPAQGLDPVRAPDPDLALKMKTSMRKIWNCCKRIWASSSRKLEKGSRWGPKMKTVAMKADANGKNFPILMR